MAKMQWLWGLELEAAALTPSSEIATLPVGNILRKQPSMKWRMDSDTGQSLVIDFGAGNDVAANALAVIGHDGASDAEYRVQGGTSVANVTNMGSPTIDTTAVSMWPVSGKPTIREWPQYNSYLTWTNDTPLRYWSIEFENLSEIGRLMLSRAFKPRFNVGHAIGMGHMSSSDIQRTDRNSRYSHKLGQSSRKWALPINSIDYDDFKQFYSEFARLLGTSRDMFIILNPDADEYRQFEMMQCEFADDMVFNGLPAFDVNGKRWNTAIPVEELI